MGIFGVDIYAQSRFGKDPSLSRPDFSVQPFKSLPLDYTTLFLTWNLPASIDCVQVQLVRNSYNIPEDETDGAIVFNQGTRVGLSYTEYAASPGFNYYTMFGCDSSTGVWVRCSDLIAILPINWGLGDRMYNLLPAIYSDRDIVLVDPYNPWPNASGSPPLQRYLGMLGFQLDFIRTEMESLMAVNDAHRVSGALLPLLAYQLGMPYENEIGMQQARSLVSNAIHLYKIKGSAQGIAEYCSILTGYPTAPTLMGHNMMLCLDDSICAAGVGTWEPWPPVNTGMPVIGGENSGLTLTAVPALMSVPGMADPTTLVGAAPPGYTAATLPGMAIKVTGASTADITTGPVATLDFLKANDAPGSITWRFQIFTPFGTPARTVRASVVGDVGTAVPIAVTPVQTLTTVPGSWVQVTVTGTVLSPYTVVQNTDGTITVTTNYYYLYPRIQIVGMAANEIHYYTLGMLWNEAPTFPTLPAYDYPRDLKVVLEPLQANLFANPLSFPTTWTHGLDGWTSLPNPAGNLLSAQQASLEQGTTAGWATVSNVTLVNTNLQAYDGLHSLQMTSVAAGVMSAVTIPDSAVTVVGGLNYTANAWVRAQAHASNAQISVRWYDSTDTLITTMSSVAVSDAVTSWTQLTVTGIAPSNAVHATVLVTIVAAAAAEVHYVDLTALYAGIVSTTLPTATLSIVPLTPGITPPLSSPCAVPNPLPPFGAGEMRVQPLVAGPVVWGGTVNTFSPAFTATGWWTDPNNSWWGSSQAGYMSSQEWIDPVQGWFMFGDSGVGNYFGAGLTTIGGDWFVQPQPSTNVDCLPFAVVPAQVFTFSVYARYLSVLNVSDATMVLGFRWFFPDGTWVETFSSTFALTTDYADPPYSFLSEAPFEAVTGLAATSCLPFIRFPSGGPQDLFGLNGAMLSPGEGQHPFLDTRLHPGDVDYSLDSNGASYYYKRYQIRTQRLRQTLPDWIPMSSTYSLVFGTGQTALSLT